MAVFISELDSYFLDKLPTLMVPNVDGDMVPVNASYHIPEGEDVPSFKGSLITFYQYDMMLDGPRLESAVEIRKNLINGNVETKAKPLPYRLYYQFDIWSEWAEDMSILLPAFQRLLPARGGIIVPGSDGDDHDLFIELVDFKNADGRLWDDAQKRAEERFFRKILRYCIHTELDANQAKTYKQVADVVIEVEQGG